MASVGYTHLREHLGLGILPPSRPAVVRPVTRVVENNGELQVPQHVAPGTDAPLQHILFALKHEGTDIQTLAAALPRIDPADLVQELRATPNGGYIRKACYLWEELTGKQLEPGVAPGGPYVQVFDPQQYITSVDRPANKWRVRFNGLGDFDYCATVRRTPEITALLGENILGQVHEFAGRTSEQMLDRALAWAYMHETQSSFDIEREAPTYDKAQAYIALLKQAHDGRPLSEEYLVELQNSAMTNPLLRELQYRTEQNWLKGPARGAPGVTYVPPPPELAAKLMDALVRFGHDGPVHGIDPLVHASLMSFGFVLIHPFMDGNGRLSRFLFHHTLCVDRVLERGLLLPVSVAIQRHEQDYLGALQSFSRPARELWSVRMVDETDFEFAFRGEEAVYRFWDATRCVEFGLAMAKEALVHDLHREVEFLAGYDEAKRRIDERFDVRGSDLGTLLLSAYDQGGRLSNRRRKQFADRVQPEAFDFIEQTVADVFGFTPSAALGDAAASAAAEADEAPQPAVARRRHRR